MKILGVIGVFAGLFFTAFAQADFKSHYDRHGGWVGGHQQHQQRQIQKGLYRGQLSPREVRNIRRQQLKIARLEGRFKRDGVLTRSERTILKKKLNQVSGRISALSRNEQYDRYGRRY